MEQTKFIYILLVQLFTQVISKRFTLCKQSLQNAIRPAVKYAQFFSTFKYLTAITFFRKDGSL